MATIIVEGDVSSYIIIGDIGTTFDQMSFRPSTVEKHIYQGDTPTFQFQIKDSGVAKNLNGLSLSFAAKSAPAASAAFIFNVTPSITSEAAGEAQTQLTASHTATAGTYTAEVTLWGSGVGTKLTAIQFPLVIEPRVA